MVSTSGARLLQPAAEKILREKLLPLAALVTPNLDEAEILGGTKNFVAGRFAFRRAGNSFAFRLRGFGERRPPEKLPRGDGRFFRRQNGTASVRAVCERRFHARHRLHLFRRDLRRARARPRFAARGGDREKFHHGGHCQAATASENILRSASLPRRQKFGRRRRKNWFAFVAFKIRLFMLFVMTGCRKVVRGPDRRDQIGRGFDQKSRRINRPGEQRVCARIGRWLSDCEKNSTPARRFQLVLTRFAPPCFPHLQIVTARRRAAARRCVRRCPRGWCCTRRDCCWRSCIETGRDC